MGKRDIILTVDERWYDALAHRLREMDTTVEEQLGRCFDELLDQLPVPEYEKVSSEIWSEDQRQRRAAQAAGCFSVFRITQDGSIDHALTEGAASLDMVHTAMRLRAYLLHKGNSSERFAETIPTAEDIAPETFQECADELRQGAGPVIAALDIDLDHGEFSTMAGADGWQTYTIRDMCMAAWHVNRKGGQDWEALRCGFAEQLEGKEIATPDRLANQETAPPDGLEIQPPEQIM